MKGFIEQYGVDINFPSYDVQDATFYPPDARIMIYAVRSVMPPDEKKFYINDIAANGQVTKKRYAANENMDNNLNIILRIEELVETRKRRVKKEITFSNSDKARI